MAVSDADVRAWFAANPNASDKEIAEAAKAADVSAAQIALATKANVADVIDRAKATGVDIRSGMTSGNDIATAGGIDAYKAQNSPVTFGAPTQTLNVADTAGLSTGTGSSNVTTPIETPTAPTTSLGQAIEAPPTDFAGFSQDDIQSYVGQVYAANPGDYFGATAKINEDLAKFNQAGYNINFDDVSKAVQQYTSGQTDASETGTGTGADEKKEEEVKLDPEIPADPNRTLSDLTPLEVSALTGTPAELTKGLIAQATGQSMPNTTITAEKIGEADTDQLTSYTKLGEIDEVTATKGAAPTEVAKPTTPEKGDYDIEATTVGDVDEATAAKLESADVSTEVKIGAIQGALSPEAIASAAEADVLEKQLVSYQLGDLFNSIQSGAPLPPWAAGAVRGVTQVMQKRGMGTSSMASAAVTQAILESGLPIAAADAAEYSKINVANLNNRQQAALQNAATVAQMDMANLDARMKAAVQNSQSFLAIDLQNLSNEQATETINYQGQLQTAFTDAAAKNAASQFNAKTQQQVDEFFAELGVQVDNANQNRASAMEQFNVDQVNSIAQFNTSLEDARDRFDSTMKAQIEQSNAQWRRDIATIDTATQNEVNRQNAANVLQTSQAALSALWQRYRDESAWIMQSTENQTARAHQLAMLEFEKTSSIDMFGLESEYATASAVGNAALSGILGIIVPRDD